MGRDTYDLMIADAAARHDVPFEWVKAVMLTESGGDPNAYRAEPQINDASYGLMQVLYSTAKGMGYKGVPEGLFDPATSLDLGAKYIAGIKARYSDDFSAMYSAYNSGSPVRYLEDTKIGRQVAANVRRANENLQSVLNSITVVDGGAPPAEGGGDLTVIIILALAVGAWFYFSR